MGDFSVHAERVEAFLGFFSRIIYKRFEIRFRQSRHEAAASFAPDGSCWKITNGMENRFSIYTLTL